MADHEFVVVPHDWLSLNMEIPQNFITSATSNETDDVSINAGAEECHGACRPKGPHRDIFMCEAQMGSREEFDSGLEVGRDNSGAHVCPTAPMRLKTGKRGVNRGAMLS